MTLSVVSWWFWDDIGLIRLLMECIPSVDLFRNCPTLFDVFIINWRWWSHLSSTNMAASDENAGTLPIDQQINPCWSQWTWCLIHPHCHNSKASSNDDVVPSTVTICPPHDDNNHKEVPSLFPLHCPSDNMDLNGEDEGDKSYEDAEVLTSTSDDEDSVPLASIQQNKCMEKENQRGIHQWVSFWHPFHFSK